VFLKNPIDKQWTKHNSEIATAILMNAKPMVTYQNQMFNFKHHPGRLMENH
jgi:hypothetical protein